MKRIFRLGMCVLTVLASGCVVGSPSAPYSAYPTRTVLVFDQPGTLRYLPGYNVYYVPDTSRDIYMVDDVWYHRADRLWYQSRSIEGPWDQIDVVNVPPPVIKLPPGYRDTKTPHEDIPWDEFKKGRRRWPQPPPPDQRPPGGDGRERPEDRWDRGEAGSPGAERRDRQDDDRIERQIPPALVVPPGGSRTPGMGPGQPPGAPEQTLPSLRIGRLSSLNRLVRSGVYYIPEIEQEVFLFEGNWYRRQDGAWYKSPNYDGRWNIEGERFVPRGLRDLSSRYREEPIERVRYPLGGPNQQVPPTRPELPRPPVIVPPPTPPARPEPPVVAPPPAAEPPERPGRVKEPGLPGSPPVAAPPVKPEPPGQGRDRQSPRDNLTPGEDVGEETAPPSTLPERGSPDEGRQDGLRKAPPEDKGKGSARKDGRTDRLPKMDIPKPDTLRRIPARDIEYLASGPEILRCQGRWYLRADGAWYGSGDYAGPWSLLSERELPQAIRVLPAGYRSEPAQEVPFDGVERNLKGKGR